MTFISGPEVATCAYEPTCPFMYVPVFRSIAHIAVEKSRSGTVKAHVNGSIRQLILLCLCAAPLAEVSGCKEKEVDVDEGLELGSACSPTDESTVAAPEDQDGPCAPGLRCEAVQDSEQDGVCAVPVEISGTVIDGLDNAPIVDALVVAFDATGAPVTDIATTDESGHYRLRVPVPRDGQGEVVDDPGITLGASAKDYQIFPGGLRPAIPVDVEFSEDTAQEENGDVSPEYVENATTTIALLPLGDSQAGGRTVSGQVTHPNSAGTLVVAGESEGEGKWAIADLGGHFTIFNVPEQSVQVHGFRQGLSLEAAELPAGSDDVLDLNLGEGGDGLATVSGSISIVNAPGDSASSIVLVPAAVFDSDLERGQVPYGLRAPDPGIDPDVSGAFEIENVLAGTYKVLAAFENDGLVRDPDESIAGTDIVEISVAGEDLTLDSGFKVTEALEIFSPGAEGPEAVDGAPTFLFADDSSEDRYQVTVRDAFGELIWENSEIPGVSGSSEVEVEYAGPALAPGMYYQFRVTSWKDKGGTSALSRSEDLRGVFYVAQ